MNTEQSFRDRLNAAGSVTELDDIKREMDAPDVRMRARTYQRNQRAYYTRKLELTQASKDRVRR